MCTRHAANFFLGIGLLAAINCDQSAPTRVNNATLTRVSTSGNGEAVGVESTLSEPLRVQLQESDRPQAGVVVDWSTSSGSVNPARSTTDQNGVAEARWVVGSALGVARARATARSGDRPTIDFSVVVSGAPTLVAEPHSNNQAGQVAEPLPVPLSVRVSEGGIARAGVVVRWRATSGAIPSSSVTDSSGVARAVWTMPNNVGTPLAYASVLAFDKSTVTFRAVAKAGAPAYIIQVDDLDFVVVERWPAASALSVGVRDRFFNPVIGQEIDWSTPSGVIRLDPARTVTNIAGISSVVLQTSSAAGYDTVVVSAGLLRKPILVVYGGGEYQVALSTVGQRLGFISRRNGSYPAIDTLPVGSVMIWQLDPFDYDEHEVVAEGLPAFVGGGNFPYANPSRVRAYFSIPGTYRYRDSYTGAAGLVVVR